MFKRKFNFQKFYQQILEKRLDADPFKNPWPKFPSNKDLKFKDQTLPLLKENAHKKDPKALAAIVGIICSDGADKDYTKILIELLNETWHTAEEDIVNVLELIKDPDSVDQLFKVAYNIPDWDEMRALAKKCMWALRAINTEKAIHALQLLEKMDDDIIQENARFHLEGMARES